MEFLLEGIVNETLRRWPIPPGTTHVGRSSDLPVSLPDRSVSRVHAALKCHDDTVSVEDLKSRNGTMVNGVRIRASQTLQAGDQVSFGNVTLSVVTDKQPIQVELAEHNRLNSTVKLDWNDVRGAAPAETEEQSPLFQVITDFGEFLVGHQPLQQIYDASLEAVEKLVPFQRACLLLLEGDGQTVLKAARCKAGRGDLDLALSHTMVDTVIHERASLLVRDALSDPVFGAANSVILEQIRSALIVPLFDNKNVIGVLYADTRELTSVYTKEHLRRLAFFANILAVKITNARLLEAQVEQERFKAEIEAARRMQLSLLTKSEDLPCPPGYSLQARLESSTEVGGDLYDALRLPRGKFGLVLGDVVGHGMGAAILMSNALAAIRALASELQDPVDLVQRVHTQMFSTTDSTSYLTLFVGVLDPATHELEYVNAGQDAPAILEPSGRVVRLESTSPPVALLPICAFESARVTLPPGALLGVWSDGITEAHPPGEQEPVFFGEVTPFTDLLAQHAGMPLAELTDLVFERIDAFLHGAKAPDDRTLLLLRRNPEA